MNWRLAGGWLLAVVATTAVAWQIVAVADERVGERPLSPVEAAAPPGTSEGTTTTTSPESSTPTSLENEFSTTTAPGSTSPTTTSGSTATTTAATSSTTSTTSEGEWSTETILTSGGTVVVSYRPGEVMYETGVPLPGFQVEIDKPGPPAVVVEFESAVLRVRVRAESKDGDLDVEVDEPSRD